MMRLGFATLGLAAGGTLSVKYSDCGKDGHAHGVIKDLEPKQIKLGDATTLTGTGTVDEAVKGGKMNMSIKSAIWPHPHITDFGADLCTAKTEEIKFGGQSIGHIKWDGVKCPLAIGAFSAPVEVLLSSSLPSMLAHVNVALTATDENNGQLICLNMEFKSAGNVELDDSNINFDEFITAEMLPPVLHGGLLGGSDKLKIAFDDCGAATKAHAKVDTLTPNELTLGVDTKFSGKGTVDEDVSAGTVNVAVKSFIPIHFTGDLCAATTWNLPLGAGKISWAGLACPLKKGDAVVECTVEMSTHIPSSLATAKIQMTAVDQNKESLLCMEMHGEIEASALVV